MTIADWLTRAKKQVLGLDAELILLEVLRRGSGREKLDRSVLVLEAEQCLSGQEVASADQWLERRRTGEPLAYILGYKDFYGYRFLVDHKVLIPRPESETLIDIARELEFERAIEVGTGSGCLAISLALEKPETKLTAVDISKAALEKAQQNYHYLCDETGLNLKIQFKQSDLLENVAKEAKQADLIVANLPYVDETWEWNAVELKYEPAQALYAENRGLALIERLIDQVVNNWGWSGEESALESSENATKRSAEKKRFLLLESDICQQEDIVKYAARRGFELVLTRGFATLLSLRPNTHQE